MGDTLQDYEQYKKDVITPLARRGDGFGSVDERLDWAMPRILDTLTEVRAVNAKTNLLAQLVAEIPGGGSIMIPQQLPFNTTLAIGQDITLRETEHKAGQITAVTIHWPGGCQMLVDVAVGHGQVQFCPKTGFLALDDTTPTFQFNEAVAETEPIWVRMRNRDGANTHQITVSVIVEGP